jgi:VIT1/CCC1 family predicted Fe2+/Mn2+ transporter
MSMSTIPETSVILCSDSHSISSLNSHAEPHFGNAEVIRDVIVGLSDGLTVPFALAAGLAALDNSRLVVIAGAAEVIAGSISMALGGFMAGLSEIEHYESERKRELWEVEHVPEKESKLGFKVKLGKQ